MCTYFGEEGINHLLYKQFAEEKPRRPVTRIFPVRQILALYFCVIRNKKDWTIHPLTLRINRILVAETNKNPVAFLMKIDI